jgi:transposase-like protein
MTNQLKPFYSKFKSQKECILFLEMIRWQGEPKCPKCGSSKYSPVKDKFAYHCNFCNRTFTATTQTVFHKSKIDLQKWFYAIYDMLLPGSNTSARDLGEKIEVAKDTAWAIQKKIKSALINNPQFILIIDKKLNETSCLTE